MSKVQEDAPQSPGIKAIYERLKMWVHAMILHTIVRSIVEAMWRFVPVETFNGTLACNLASDKMLEGSWIAPRTSSLAVWGDERKATAASFWEDGWFIYWKGWNTLFVRVGTPVGADNIASFLAPPPSSAPQKPPGNPRSERDSDPDPRSYAMSYLALIKRDFQVFGVASERERFKKWALKPHTEIPIAPGKEFSLTFATTVYMSGVGTTSSKIDNSNYVIRCTDPTIGVNMRAWESLRARAEYVWEHRTKYLNMGASPITNVLLYGPPGTGKTTLVQRIATAMGCTIEFARLPDPDETKIIPISVDDPDCDLEDRDRPIANYKDLLASGVDLWEARRRQMTGWRYSGETVAFTGVSQITLFDDFDRTFDGMTKGPLLTEMLRFLESRPVTSPVMHVACCNRIDRLPPALLNRFHVIHVEELGTLQIQQILDVWFPGQVATAQVAQQLTGKLKDLRTLRAAIQQNIPLEQLPARVEEIYAEARRLHLDSREAHEEVEEEQDTLEQAANIARGKISARIAHNQKRAQRAMQFRDLDNKPQDSPTSPDYAFTKVAVEPLKASSSSYLHVSHLLSDARILPADDEDR